MLPTHTYLANDRHLKEKIYRFRYEIYVEAMQRRQLYADHFKCLIEEPADEDGYNFLSIQNDEVVAVIRGNIANSPAMSYYRKIFKTDSLDVDTSKMFITTKLMVRPDLRGTLIGPRLVSYYASEVCRMGATTGLIDCNRHLIPFFERLGFFSYMGWAFHKEFGTVRPMVVALDTLQYFKSIRSILFEAVKPHVHDGVYDLVRRVAKPPASASVRLSFEAIFAQPLRLAAE